MFVRTILENKGRDGAPGVIRSVTPGTSVAEAVSVMSRHRIGAVLVLDGDTIRGILSERDVVHLVGRGGAEALGSPVENAMTPDPVTCAPGDGVDRAMAVMNERRFRHLPVVEGGRLVGMISIGDVVKAKIDEAEREAATLKDYIAG